MNMNSAVSSSPENLHFGKIVATLGPASESEEGVTSLIDAGVDVFRLNFSHGSHEEQGMRTKRIRALEGRVGRSIGIIADLQGPKLRVGEVISEKGVMLGAGNQFVFCLKEITGDEKSVSLMHPEIFKAAKVGMDILVDDGRLCFRVDAVQDTILKTTVITGGLLKRRKGVNIPMVQLPIDAITEKDREDLVFALSQGVDWIALSFVQRPEDVRQARKLIGDKAGIIAKIEKPSALECIEDIINEVDVIMVARGDLGVEIPPEDVPSAQKRMIALCRQVGKPVIVATHMLDSMVDSPYPTRAEVSDVANALYDGADAVMLSAETAAGSYIAESVSMMRRIIRRTVADPEFFSTVHRLEVDKGHCAYDTSTVDALCESAEKDKAIAAAIVLEGNTDVAACYARRRCPFPLLAGTRDERLARKTALFWGVTGVVTEESKPDPIQAARERGFISDADTVAVV